VGSVGSPVKPNGESVDPVASSGTPNSSYRALALTVPLASVLLRTDAR
jgi:hypothetical protein